MFFSRPLAKSTVLWSHPFSEVIVSNVCNIGSYRSWTSSSTTCLWIHLVSQNTLTFWTGIFFFLLLFLFSSSIIDSNSIVLFGEYLKNSPSSVIELSIFRISGTSLQVWQRARFRSWLLQWKYCACSTVAWNNLAQPLICPLKFAAPS